MARRNSHLLPTPDSHPLNLSNPPNHNPQWHFERTMLVPTENTMFNHNVRIPNPHPANSGAVHGQFHYPLSAASSSQSSTYSTRYAPFCYDQRTNVNCANMVYPREENVRVAFKRKHTSTHPAYQNDLGYYTTERSNLQLKPVPGCCWPQSSTSIATSYPCDNLVFAGEQHQRNVRSRHGDTSFNPSWQSLSNPSHQLYTSVNNFSSNVVGQWDLPPPPEAPAHLIHPTGTGFSNYIVNHSFAGNTITCANTNNHGASSSAVLPTSHDFATRGTVEGPSRYKLRQISAPLFKDSFPPVTGSNAFHRNPRPPPIRNGCLRICNEAQPLFNEENERVRWTSQGSAMIDMPSYFNPLDLYDEYRDLRLDIDDMNYEELLALEDRIGSVHTGLSEDQLSSCLTKTTYNSSAPEDLLESSCSICLEEFKDEENIGMMKCHHAHHVSCINDWLRIKNACPICKSPAV